MNRRKWMKSGALLATGLAAAPWKWAAAAPAARPAAAGALLPYKELQQTLREFPVMEARLLANENPFGPSAKAKQAFINAFDESYRYAFAEKMALQKLIAEKENVTPEHVLLGAGSTELLLTASLHYGMRDGHILSADPSYTSLMRMAERVGSEWKKVPLTKDYKHDLNAMANQTGANTNLVYVCNPNNPTGTILEPKKLKDFCVTVSKKAPVFVDEAYIDYLDDPAANSMISCVREGHNVLVARTFSKVHAFAGLRVGYLIGQPAVLQELDKYYTGGGTVSGPSTQAAIASYQDGEFIAYSKKMNEASKDYAVGVLKAMNYDFVPSSTNFMLFPLRMPGDRFREAMMQQGVGIRTWEFNRQHWCRVSMGTMDDMKRFGQAFEKVVS